MRFPCLGGDFFWSADLLNPAQRVAENQEQASVSAAACCEFFCCCIEQAVFFVYNDLFFVLFHFFPPAKTAMRELAVSSKSPPSNKKRPGEEVKSNTTRSTKAFFKPQCYGSTKCAEKCTFVQRSKSKNEKYCCNYHRLQNLSDIFDPL